MKKRNKGKLLGICGPEGAGKTTVANRLVGNRETVKVVKVVTDPEEFVINVMFGLSRKDPTIRDSVWGLTFDEAAQVVKELLRAYVDSNYEYPPSALVAYETKKFGNEWVEMALADPLKIVSSVIFGMDCELLMGKNAKYRAAREIVTTVRSYDQVPGGYMTGRFVLEYLGTNVFRNHFDDLTWVKIAQRQIDELRAAGTNVVMSDVRFVNEKDFIKSAGGELLFIYRDLRDIRVNANDKDRHPAKWHYKKFISCSDELPIHWLFNNDSLESLLDAVDIYNSTGTWIA